ncbi:MAG: phosphatidylglycerophosphatase A [Thermodesulfobacteriota bacterium]
MKYALWKYPVHFLAYGLGTGLMPFAPGTFGSLVGVVLFWFMAPLAASVYVGVFLVMVPAGIFICGQTARDIGSVDPGMIVYDEITGFLVAMYLLPPRWQWILAGFTIYRVFDIWKPWPIHILEESFGLGTSIMADDLIAGLYTLTILHAAQVIKNRCFPNVI